MAVFGQGLLNTFIPIQRNRPTVSESERPTIGPRFILDPDWNEMPQPRGVISGLAKLLGIGFLGSVIAWQIFSALSEAAGYESILQSELEQWSISEQLVLIVLIAPLLEETIYRLPLQRRFRPGLIALSLAIGALFFAGANSAAFWVILALAAAVVLVGFNADLCERIQQKWSANPRIPIWFATFIFGLIHIVNFNVQWSIFAVLVAPLVVSPQIWLGLMFTIARVRYGWWAGLVLHATHNGLIWSISGLAS